MYTSRILFSLFSFLSVSLHASTGDLAVVKDFEIKKYIGDWYEIARYETKHQKGCVKSWAHYSLDKNNALSIVNTCKKEDGSEKTVTGISKVEDPKTPAKIKVNFTPAWLRFFGIGWGNYWVIKLGEDYQYAVVSEPKKEYLWILSRQPRMDDKLYTEILEWLKHHGFDTNKLIKSNS